VKKEIMHVLTEDEEMIQIHWKDDVKRGKYCRKYAKLCFENKIRKSKVIRKLKIT
jgi:hypothetical protein